MAYNTKLKTDVNGKPIPQYYNQATREYEALEGNNGAARHIIYGADGNPIATAGNKLAVRASEVETLLESLDGKDIATQATLAEVLAKLSDDPATQTTLAAILAKIIDAPATEAKQDTIIGHVDGIEGALTTLNGKDFATQTTLATLLTKTGFDAKADITLSALRDAIRGNSNKTLSDLATALTSVATAAKQDTLAGLVATAANQTAIKNLIGALDAAAVTDPASTTAVLIALVKGLLKQMQGGGTGSMPVQLSGSIESVTAAPLTGVKTVTATAAEIFAGASVKANRRKLIIRNEDPVLRMRIGPSSVTQQNGYPIEPGATVNIQFDPATAVAIYGISEGAALSAAILEV